MMVHVFKGRSKNYGFTQNELGMNLVSKLGPWKYFKSLKLESGRNRIGVDVNEALTNILAQGYHILRADVTFEEDSNV
jgi:hypothetical protein